MTWTVYCLCHPETGEIYYIGCTMNFEQRIRTHYWETGKHKDAFDKNPNLRVLPKSWRGEATPTSRKAALIALYRAGKENVVPKYLRQFNDASLAGAYEERMIKKHKPACNDHGRVMVYYPKEHKLPAAWLSPLRYQAKKGK